MNRFLKRKQTNNLIERYSGNTGNFPRNKIELNIHGKEVSSFKYIINIYIYKIIQ